MKKHLAPILLGLILIFIIQGSSVFADSSTHTYEYFKDGSYIETVIESENTALQKSSSISLLSASTTVTKNKTAYYKSASGKILWYVRVTGTFTYGSGSANCTKSTVTAVSSSTTWKISSKSSSKSGATATATAKATQYLDGTQIQQKSKTVTLTCSPTGKFN